MALMTARRVWMWLHRWIGLTLGMLLAAAALFGSLMTVLRPLDEVMHPALFRAPLHDAAQAVVASSTPYETLRRRVADEFGPKATMTIRPPREEGESLRVSVRSPSWAGTVYLDPVTVIEIARRGETEGVANFVFELHSELLLGDTGKATLAFTALAYLLLLITGLILWWPMNAAQWKHAFKLKLDKGTTRSLFDLHRFAGAVLGLLITVTVASGAWMAYRPIGGWLNTLVGDAAPKPPKVEKTQGERVPLDFVVAEARMRWPGAQLGFIQLGSADTRPIRLRFKLPGDPHPNGLSSIWAHPVDGRVLSQQRLDELDLAVRSTAWIYPLHAGELFGVANRVITGVLGLVLFGMGVTGAWLWWRRRR